MYSQIEQNRPVTRSMTKTIYEKSNNNYVHRPVTRSMTNESNNNTIVSRRPITRSMTNKNIIRPGPITRSLSLKINII